MGLLLPRPAVNRGPGQHGNTRPDLPPWSRTDEAQLQAPWLHPYVRWEPHFLQAASSCSLSKALQGQSGHSCRVQTPLMNPFFKFPSFKFF